MNGDSTAPPLPQDHPDVANNPAGIELCPAFSKSMRFDNALELPVRSRETSIASQADLPETLRMARKQLSESRLTHWVVVVAFGVIFLGAMVAGQRAIKVEVRP